MSIYKSALHASQDWLRHQILSPFRGRQYLTVLTIHHCTRAELLQRFFEWAIPHYDFVRLEDSIDRLKSEALKKPLLAITYDDGDKSVFENALPVHKAFSIPATLFVCTTWADRGVAFHHDEYRRRSMTWDEIREWSRSGMSLGGHGISHVPLSCCSFARAKSEILLSCDRIQDECNTKVLSFAYPWGHYTKEVESWLNESERIRFALTCDDGDVYSWHRGVNIPRRPLELLRRPGEYRLHKSSLLGKIRAQVNLDLMASAPKPFTLDRFCCESCPDTVRSS